MKHIRAHIAAQERHKERVTERGELMRYFCERLNRERLSDGYPPLTLARMGRILQGIPTKDLYYLKRVCEDAKHFSKKFWWEIDPKKHEKSFTHPPEVLAEKILEDNSKKRFPEERKNGRR